MSDPKSNSLDVAAVARLACLAVALLFGLRARAQYDPDWSRHFRLGAVIGLNIKADFTVGGMTTLRSSGAPGPTGVHGANHVYDDGYVRVDQTGNTQGKTSFWGYDRASQWNAGASTLFMHDTTSLTTGSAAGQSDGGVLPGFELVYGGNLWYWKRFRIGWDLGFGLLPIDIGIQRTTPASADQTIYSFDTMGTVLPTAPYHGGASGRGTLIGDVASQVGTTNVSGPATVSDRLDVILYTIRLGPSVYWDFNRHLGMSVGAGGAIGIVSGDLKFSQAFNGTQHGGQISDTDVVYGGYVNTTLLCHVIRNGDIFLGAQFMPLGNATIGGGANQGRLKLGGAVYVSAGINWPF